MFHHARFLVALFVTPFVLGGCTCNRTPSAISDGTAARPRVPGSKTELHQAPPIVFSAGRATGEAAPSSEPIPDGAPQRYVVELGAGRQATIALERDGSFRCEYTCPGQPFPGLIRGRAYRAKGGVALPGIGTGPDHPLVAPLDGEKLNLSAELLARSSNLGKMCP